MSPAREVIYHCVTALKADEEHKGLTKTKQP